MSARPLDQVAAAGTRRIEWAARRMPVLASIREHLRETGSIAGLRIGVSLVLEPKTANLALALQSAGADVSVYCPGRNTKDEVARALEAAGVRVFAEEDSGSDRDLELARAFLETAPDILVDDGAAMIRLAHREYPKLVGHMLGAAEETTSGVRPLRVMHEQGALRIPVIAVNDARTKYLFDNIYGTGQSCVMAFLDITNLQLAGRVVVVVGYGWVGQGVARYAAALGARVVISEIDAVKGLRALYDGYRVRSLTDVAPEAEIIFAATGIAGAVTAAHLSRLRDGAFLCTAGAGSIELPMPFLESLGNRVDLRPNVAAYRLPETGNTILVLAGGDCVNCAAAEGNPIEVMDLSFALQAVAVERIAVEARDWPPGVYPIGKDLETAVAASQLEREGGSLENVTEELSAAMRSW